MSGFVAFMKIVIVEDDDVPRLILRRVLRSFGDEVIEFSTGQDAWEFLRTGETQVLITDWMMPGLDGLELCRRLRERDSQGPYVYAILLTARNSRLDRLKALEAGADDLLAKPLDQAELFARLKVATRIISMEEQLRNRSTELMRMHSELERRNIQLADMAFRDGLTGLKNHRYFREALEAQFLLAQRNLSPLSVIMLDVDALWRCRPARDWPDLAVQRPVPRHGGSLWRRGVRRALAFDRRRGEPADRPEDSPGGRGASLAAPADHHQPGDRHDDRDFHPRLDPAGTGRSLALSIQGRGSESHHPRGRPPPNRRPSSESDLRRSID
jgi:DNA-binding response OmpR family regulator